jgi:hypothetical protein
MSIPSQQKETLPEIDSLPKEFGRQVGGLAVSSSCKEEGGSFE